MSNVATTERRVTLACSGSLTRTVEPTDQGRSSFDVGGGMIIVKEKEEEKGSMVYEPAVLVVLVSHHDNFLNKEESVKKFPEHF